MVKFWSILKTLFGFIFFLILIYLLNSIFMPWFESLSLLGINIGWIFTFLLICFYLFVIFGSLGLKIGKVKSLFVMLTTIIIFSIYFWLIHDSFNPTKNISLLAISILSIFGVYKLFELVYNYYLDKNKKL
jgi:uncharacterized membrane protein